MNLKICIQKDGSNKSFVELGLFRQYVGALCCFLIVGCEVGSESIIMLENG